MSPVSECQTFRLSGEMLSPHGLDKDDTANSQPSSENITDQVRGKV